VLSDLAIGDEIYFHSPSILDLEKSAESEANGRTCLFCSLINHELKHEADVFGTYDIEGKWRPKNESRSPVVIKPSRDAAGVAPSLVVFCGERRCIIGCVRIPGECCSGFPSLGCTASFGEAGP